jgi:hypothetical protein
VLGRTTRGLVQGALAATLVSCGGAGDYGDSEYGDAAGGLAIGVAATAVNRSITGDCWGRCSPGFSCNRENGLCERGDCDPPCPGGMSCTLTTTGTECRGDPTPVIDPF